MANETSPCVRRSDTRRELRRHCPDNPPAVLKCRRRVGRGPFSRARGATSPRRKYGFLFSVRACAAPVTVVPIGRETGPRFFRGRHSETLNLTGRPFLNDGLASDNAPLQSSAKIQPAGVRKGHNRQSSSRKSAPRSYGSCFGSINLALSAPLGATRRS